MNPYDSIMKNLRDAGFDESKLTDLLSRKDVKPVHVINVVRDQKNRKILFIRHTPADTVVAFEGFQVTLDQLTLLIDRNVARDWGL